MSVRLDKCVTFEESPDDGIYMRRLTPADVVELARSLPGAEELLVEINSALDAGRYLAIPLPEGERSDA